MRSSISAYSDGAIRTRGKSVGSTSVGVPVGVPAHSVSGSPPSRRASLAIATIIVNHGSLDGIFQTFVISANAMDGVPLGLSTVTRTPWHSGFPVEKKKRTEVSEITSYRFREDLYSLPRSVRCCTSLEDCSGTFAMESYPASATGELGSDSLPLVAHPVTVLLVKVSTRSAAKK